MVRKNVLMVAVAMLAAPAFASAQSSTVTATATVGQSAVVTGAGDLAFGTLVTGSDNTIVADGGAVTRTLDYNHDVDVTFDNVPAALTSAGAADLPISLMCAAQLGGVWSTPVPCSPTVPIALDVGTSLTQAILGFGGTILGADVATAAAGDYTGSFDIVITAR
jgi:hypothetical protein